MIGAGRRGGPGAHLLPQIHPNCVKMWILTEHLSNVGRGPQTSEMARKSPHDWVGQMKKKREREKGIGTGSVPSEGAVGEERLGLWKSLNGGTEGELHLEKSATTSLQKENGERPACIDSQYQGPELPSLRCPVHMGVGC